MNRELQIEKEIDALYEEKEGLRSRRTLKCPKCQKRSTLKKWILINDHYYVQPFSCTGGDYWTFKEFQIYCPKCEDFSRVYTHSTMWDQDDKKDNDRFQFIRKHSEYFGETLGMWGDRYNGTIDHIREMNENT